MKENGREKAIEKIAVLTKEVPPEQQMRILGYLEGFKDGVSKSTVNLSGVKENEKTVQME